MHESYVPEAKPGTELARGELRFPGDLYTPLWKRGTARNKEAMCRLCPPEQWFCVKISAYWYHLHFLHGVSSATGVPFTGPVAERYNADLRIREGQCHKCNKWVPLDPARPTVVKVPEIYWWKHAQKCHSKK
ncbi:hypothetical protein BCR44DRAFT_1391980 [Catenaria anguillulae PL171]|uniref:Transcription regulator Rua1 C-terminal domain-containing protein n=1 Tax=Catenaria anguillulae PL171 TaxID=765915 RepID=A0A1Y2HEK4_9FUNG|nr:hypothetical protein BCR44DRAFT_1391980 [Catenaria anguillulae PL171]